MSVRFDEWIEQEFIEYNPLCKHKMRFKSTNSMNFSGGLRVSVCSMLGSFDTVHPRILCQHCQHNAIVVVVVVIVG